MDSQQADELRPYQLRGPVRIRRPDQHGPAVHSVSLRHHQLHGRAPAAHGGGSPGRRQRGPYFLHDIHVPAIQLLYGRAVHRHIHHFWEPAGRQRIPRPKRGYIYHHPVMAVSLHVPGHYYGQHLKRPRQDFIHLFPECDCHGHTAGVCALCHSQIRNSGIPVGHAGQ